MQLIVITGPSGSGKTVLGEKLADTLKDSIVIKTDSYYRDDMIIKLLSFLFYDIYDRIISIKDKQLIQIIESIINKDNNVIFSYYDFKSKVSTKQIKYIRNIRYIILEGIFAHRLNLNYRNTINIIIEQKKEICKNRRIKRDQNERGRNINEVIKKFNKSWYLYFKNLRKFKEQNKVITLRLDDNFKYKEIIYKIKGI